jgi:acyl-coenzyme A thioesterase PaaI-like protein
MSDAPRGTADGDATGPASSTSMSDPSRPGADAVAGWLSGRDGSEHAELARVADAVRRIIANLHGTSGDAETLAGMAEQLEAVAAATEELPRTDLSRLAEAAVAAADGRDHGPTFFDFSPIAGRGNPVAPPISVELVDGVVHGRAHLERPYEGPPGHVHGGWVAAMFDEVLGMVQAASGEPGMTGILTVRYRAPTPLYADLDLRAELVRVEGRKLFTEGTLHHGDTLCATAEGVFIKVDFARLMS